MSTLVFLFKAVLMASWQGSLAIGLVLLARQALGPRVPARWRYLLWILVLVRLLAPAVTLPHNPASLQNIRVVARPFEAAPPTAPEPVSEPVALPALAIPARPDVRWSAWQWAAVGWAAGGAVFAAVLATSAWRMRRRLREPLPAVDPDTLALWRDRCRELLRREPPRLVAVDWIASPALVGLWRPTLLIPRVSSFSREDWEHVFAHEIAHLRCRDHWSQLLQLMALGVHWFNPFVWLGFRRLRADRELAADEWALRRLADGRSLAYGATLLKAVAGRPAFQPGLVGISEDGSQMKQRLQRIVAFLPRRPVYGSIMGCVIALGLAAVVLGQKPADPAPAPKSDPPATSAQDLLDRLRAAARAGDGKGVKSLIHEEHSPALGVEGAKKMLDDLVHSRELTAFTTLLDPLRQTNLGKDWEPGDDLLAGLVKDDRRDFIDALLARNLDLESLRRATKDAPPPAAEWVNRRIAEVTQQRADINALGRAANDGDLATIRRLLDAGVDVNATDKDDNTILIETVHKDRLEAARLLLDRGADPNKTRFPGWDYSPLCLVNSVPMAELLKKAGGDVHGKLFGRDTSILTYVVVWSKPEVVAWFLDQGLDPKMIGDNDQTLLFGLKDARTAALLLDRGVDPNRIDEFGDPPICHARNAEVAQVLIQHGAKLAGFKEPLLPRMIQFGSPGAIEAVLASQAKPDHAEVQSALMSACFMDRDEIARVLLKHGALPGELSLWSGSPKEAMLPLMACTINPCPKTAQILLDAGADPNAGERPGVILQNAIANNHKDVVEVLRKAGAKGVADLAYAITVRDEAAIVRLLEAAPTFAENADYWDGALIAGVRTGDLRAVRAAGAKGMPIGHDPNALREAASEGRADILAEFLKRRGKDDDDGTLDEALWGATLRSRSYRQPSPASDYERCVAMLIAAGAPFRDNMMSGAVFTERPGGNLRIVEMLAQAGVDPNPPMPTERNPNGRLLDVIQEWLADPTQKRMAPDADVIVALTRLAARPAPTDRQWFMSKVQVSTEDGVSTSDGGTTVYGDAPTPTGVLQGAARVEREGVAPLWVPSDAKSVRVAAVRKDYAPAFAGPFAPPYEKSMASLQFQLTRGFSASVAVVDQAGKPLAGVKLEAYYREMSRLDSAKIGGLAATTDAAGLATFEHLGAAPVNIRHVGKNGSEQMIKVSLDPKTPLRWELNGLEEEVQE